MREANHLAETIAGFLNAFDVLDGGADYKIIVTDTAGNVATIYRTGPHGRPHGGGWESDEGFDQKEHLMRLRLNLANEVEGDGTGGVNAAPPCPRPDVIPVAQNVIRKAMEKK